MSALQKGKCDFYLLWEEKKRQVDIPLGAYLNGCQVKYEIAYDFFFPYGAAEMCVNIQISPLTNLFHQNIHVVLHPFLLKCNPLALDL